MKIQATKEDLLTGIQTVQNAVSGKAAIPILANILIESTKESTKLTATDLEIAITCQINTQESEAGSVTIPAKRFGDVIKELPFGTIINLSVKKNFSVVMETTRSFFRLVGLSREDFPQIPDFGEGNVIKIPQNTLKKMIQMTSFCVSHDEARHVLNGILFSFKDKQLKLVATDGRRLALITQELPQPTGIKKDVIVPAKCIQELMRNLEGESDVLVSLKENQMRFRLGAATLTTRLIQGEFPNYEQVIPQKPKERVRIHTQDFLSATKRASILTSQESQAVKLDFVKGKLIISKSTPDVGEIREELDIDYKGSDFSIGFNPTFLVDALKNIEDMDIKFEFTDPEKPGVIQAKDDYTYIILPMQLTS